ncbi:mechanosensitive ion channel family protein [Pseudoxanthobacter sp. M-2]|uniref:mechanosensitive ion channel domain-containing protein n=1 Tax=Pseudoxanthobacter sp. M-2 TaxID=3078754 RepID=UPI0038FC1CE4
MSDRRNAGTCAPERAGARRGRPLLQAALGLVVAFGLACAVAPGVSAQEAGAAHATGGHAAAAAAPAAPAETTGQALVTEVAAEEIDIQLALEAARDQLREAIASAPELPDEIGEAVEKEAPPGAGNWLPSALAVGVVAILIGLIADWLFQKWARRRWLSKLPAVPEHLHERIGWLLICTAIGVCGALVLGIVAVVAKEIAHGMAPYAHRTVMIMIAAAVLARAFTAIVKCVIAPHMPHQRVLNFDDGEARRLTRDVNVVVTLAVVVLALNTWLAGLAISDAARDLIAIVLSGLGVLLIIGVCVVNRRAIAEAILPPTGRPAPIWKRWLVYNWHLFVIVYLLAAWLVRSVRLLLGHPGAEALVVAPLPILIICLGLYGIAVLVIERSMKRLPELYAGHSRADEGKRIADYRDLLERGAALVVIFGGIAVLLHLWGVDFIGQPDVGGRIFDVLVVVFLGWLAYDAVKIWIDRKIAEEDSSPHGPDGADVDSGDVPMAAGKSRLATILPLLRFFLLASIVVMVAMMALSQIGVDITPLFAGAGVIGLAIGFGSRQLVEDVISGAFYLVDDAFRVGEYIDIGKIKGTVEKISIRSFQLRHQNGPLNTIRFGEVASITNFSRDWAIMKLPLRLPLDTDSEKVRKIIKKVGEELLADETYGSMFLDPLKSQGVYEMDDSAMIIRVKFRTKPNDQFVLRRVVYHRIQAAFQKAGIKFANRVVTVRVEGEPGTPEYAAARTQAIQAGAVDAIALTDEAAAKKAGG